MTFVFLRFWQLFGYTWISMMEFIEKIFLHKSKVGGLKKFVQYVPLFFWFNTFEGMSFFQQYFLAKGGGLGFWWLAFPIHFWSYFHAPYTFLASHSKKFKCLARSEVINWCMVFSCQSKRNPRLRPSRDRVIKFYTGSKVLEFLTASSIFKVLNPSGPPRNIYAL